MASVPWKINHNGNVTEEYIYTIYPEAIQRSPME
jgi:hypothetical protein